jgi:hypothetical protein
MRITMRITMRIPIIGYPITIMPALARAVAETKRLSTDGNSQDG